MPVVGFLTGTSTPKGNFANLDERRKVIEGVWHGYNASLTLASAKSDGTLLAEGRKWDVENYKVYCNFTSDGKIENGIFKAVDKFPRLTRDSGTLVIDAEDAGKDDKRSDSKQPGYCSRLHRRSAGRPKKSSLLSPPAKPVCHASTTLNSSPRIRSRESRN